MIDKEDDNREEDDLTPEEELNAQNEMELLRLNMEYGAESYISDDAPPELVRQFLENIKKWESSIKDNPEMVLIREVLADADYPEAEDVPATDYEDAIEHFLQLLLDNGIIIDKPDHLSARDFYFFLTNDLLDQEVLAFRPPGFIHGLLYSDIKKDHPDNIPEIAEEEIRDLFHLADYEGINIAPEEYLEISFIDLLDEVTGWQQSRPYRNLEKLELDEVIENDDHHIVTFDCYYTHGRNAQKVVKGLAVVRVQLIDGEYYVTYIKLPDFEF